MYSNVFIHHERLFMSGQKLQLFKSFKPCNGSFLVSHYIFEESCILLESPFLAELNGRIFPPLYIKVSASYDHIIKYM